MSKMVLKSIILVALLVMQFQSVYSQDYITLKEGDNLTVSLLRMDSGKVYFRQFDNADTVIYFLQNENVNAIYFASNKISKNKDISFKEDPIYKSINQIVKPVYIYPTDGEMIIATINSFSENQIQFHLAFANDTNTYFLKKAEINKITFKEVSPSQKKMAILLIWNS
jgi:hypothetical protein